MTFAEMLNLYNLLSASHLYILGFVFNGLLYFAEMDFETLTQYMKADRASSSRGGFAKVRIKMSASQKAELVKTANICGKASDLMADSNHNKGENFERIITELLTDEKWVKDSVPFNVAGDITLNGENVQIKLDMAELTNEKFLRKLA